MFQPFIEHPFGHLLLQVFLSFSVPAITSHVSFCVSLAQEHVSWCIFLREIYLAVVSAFLRDRLQQTPERNWRNWIICGVLLGLLSLTRPNGMIVIGLFIVWSIIMVWQQFLSWRVAARGILVTTFIAFVLIAPWTIRNYLVSHTFIPV